MATSHYKYLSRGDKILLLKNGEIISDENVVNEYIKAEEQKEEEEIMKHEVEE